MTQARSAGTDIETLEAEVARLRAQLDLAWDASEAGGQDAAVLSQLANTLQWDGAPRSLRAVLPLARVLRRVSSSTGGTGGAASAPGAATAAASYRPSLAKRIALRIYLLLRPVMLPVARRLHRLLGRLLEKEGLISQREAAGGTAGVQATAELLRSIEAAMLTLALQRGQNG